MKRRVQVSFLYEDEPYFMCHPYVVYRSGDGLVFLEGLWAGNGLRDFDISKLRDFQVTDKPFEPDLPIDLNDPKYVQVFCSVHNVDIAEKRPKP